MNQNEEIEIDLIDMCKYILSKWVILIAAMVVFAGAAFGYTKLKSETEYSTNMKLYVTVPKTSDKVLIRDNANELVQDYIELIGTDLVAKEIAKVSDVSKADIKESLSAEPVVGTRFVKITVKTDSKQKTKEIAKEALPVITKTITKVLKKDQPIVVDDARKIKTSQTMSMKKNVGVGAAGGFVLAAGIFFVSYLVRAGRRKL
jgi:capsular polysaccharide biosynthesis protein